MDQFRVLTSLEVAGPRNFRRNRAFGGGCLASEPVAWPPILKP